MINELNEIKKGNMVVPKNLQLDLTNKCNNDCTICYYHIHNHLNEFNKNDELTYEEASKIIKEASNYGIKSIEKTGGGEPLLVRYFDKISQLSRNLGLERALVTNGVLLSKHVNEVKDYSWVRVSMDAITEEAYNNVKRTKGGLRHVKKGLEKLCEVKDKNCIVGVSMVVCKENYSNIYYLTKYAKEIGADNIRISMAYTPEKERIFDGIYDKIVNQVDLAKELEDDKFKVFSFSNRINEISGKKKGGFCSYHHLTTAVGANGVLYPCCYFKYISKYNLGNLKDNTFKEVWEGYKRKEFINKTAKDCQASCWMVDKNAYARYIMQDKSDVPHLNFP
jgi:MoaA/NifB/PqqE/SkfB family radical SAM enzyme